MSNVLYSTEFGRALLDNSLEAMREMPSDSIDLVVTSPPYALHFKKEYGNADQKNYLNWFAPFASEILRVLKPSGSLVLNIGGTWTPGAPTRSLYHVRLLLHLCDELGFKFCQEFFWYNPAKLPAPAEWVNVRRIRVKDSVEYIYWLGKTDNPKADNTNVLQEYSKDMLRLIKRGVVPTRRPSGHNIKESFAQDKGGAIPGNLITCGNNESNSDFLGALKKAGRRIHPARFPSELPRFFIKFLTEPGDLVMDPFAGSNTTGYVAETLRRKWIAIEINEEYLTDSRLRFDLLLNPPVDSIFSEQPHKPKLRLVVDNKTT
ncbi:MAG TPA: site-specific DNA-methyltransferase [Acidobacteriota bacterium]|nr:site-specific DNA-methyltransferase [Acidobacteriota bacterium]HNT16274.1 site-specific DNA-methyltransferase [Acidobacteriota bacterium]